MSYTTKKISEKITLLADETDGAVYLIKGRDMSLVFDTGWDSRPLKPMADSLLKTPYKVIFSHGHVDHVGRSGEFDAVYMDKNDMGIYRSNPARKMPHLTFISEDKILPVENVIDLGDRVIDVVPCYGHTPGSILLVDRREKAVFTGDAIGSGCGVWLQCTGALKVSRYRENLKNCLEQLKELGVDESWNFYGGHLGQEKMSKVSDYNRPDINLMSDMQRLCGLVMDKKVEFTPADVMEFDEGKPYYASHGKAEMFFVLEKI